MKLLKSVGKWLVWQREPISQIPILRPQMESRLLTAYSIFYIVLAFFIGWLCLKYPLPIWGTWKLSQDVWYIFIFKIGALLIFPALVFRAWGYGLKELIVRDWKFSIKSIVFLTLAVAIGLFINMRHFRLVSELGLDFSSIEVLSKTSLAIALPLLTAGIPEELVFRGMLQTRLEAILGRVLGILLSSLLFTAWHLPTRYLLAEGVEGQAGNFISVFFGTGAPVFIVSLIFALLWDRYRSLIPLIALHWAIDIPPSLSSFLGVRF